VKSRRVGGATYQVRRSEEPPRSTLAIRWLVATAVSAERRCLRLANEILAAATLGASVNAVKTCTKMAESNKAFAHYRVSCAVLAGIRPIRTELMSKMLLRLNQKSD